jgi:hypothetical protein
MNAMNRLGLAALGFVGLFGAAGCASEMAPVSAKAPTEPMAAPSSAGYGQPAPAAPAQPSFSGYGSGQVSAESAAPEPPPPPPAKSSVSVQGSARFDMDRMDKKAERGPAAEPPADRPGLGTQWGETRTSRISMVSFERADAGSPFAAAALYYNDEEGARAQAGASGFRRTPSGMFTVANGLVSIGLRDEGHRFFTGFLAGGRSYAVGEAGHRYTIVVKNNTNFRLEVVLSVDGLDVLDGKAAAFSKRGYIVDPRAELEVDGFRQSVDAVAAFRFGSVRGSYAGQKYGDTRNVGVIGVALFNEIGTVPVPWTPDEVQRRRDANPFPGQFATPP